ncbi:MAG TPA: hypothetical protein PLV83_01775 [Bacilli bacterium]|nr:hypothetical protein [Bacilli bacterium]
MDEIFEVYKEELKESIKINNQFNNFDNYIDMIIKNTYKFIYILMDKIEKNKEIKDGYITYSLSLPRNIEFNRNNIKNKYNIWPYDFLFYLDKDRKDFVISERLLLETIGHFFQISEDYENIYENEEFIIVPKIYFKIEQNKLDELYNAIMEDDKKVFIKER